MGIFYGRSYTQLYGKKCLQIGVEWNTMVDKWEKVVNIEIKEDYGFAAIGLSERTK
jgi:hypothetical protein